jgi:8-oxo-dGTP pyrophosphatase MutT (NUDIX family)
MSYETLNDKLLKGKDDKFFVSIVPVSIEGAVLMGRRTEDGIWTTPGGGAESHESPEQAAKRELFEEAGLVAGGELELVSVGETPRGYRIFSFLWRMPRGAHEMATARLDPDKEVKTWKMFRPHEFPAAVQSEENASRLKTIREALMKFHKVSKADIDVLLLTDKLSKGGPGSGIQGHVTAQKPSPLHPHVGADPAKPVNKLQAHLTALEHGGVIPGVSTKSGKPVVTNMDQAKAHGYSVQDHVDAMNAHYELAQKTQAMLEKFKMAGHKVPAEGAKIAQFHQKKMKEHMRAREYLENRSKHTAEAIKEKKKAAVASVKKSITQMGGGLGDRDLDIGSFAQANGQGHAEWMERLYSGMAGFSFGDDPREFQTPAGTLHLTKVDDGLYSGYMTRNEEGLLDNAKIRIERITIPELVQLMIAKEWIDNHMLDDDQAESEPAPAPEALVALNQTLQAPAPSVAGPTADQKIQILSLIGRLLS